MNDRIVFLGTRGSIPVSGPGFIKYGGATTCVLATLAGQDILLDAGSGLMALPREQMVAPALPILLSHLHIDHILGVSMSPFFMREGKRVDLYGAARDGADLHTAFSRLLSRPLWPVGPDDMAADVVFHPLSDDLTIGPVRVEYMEGAHPGGVTLYKLIGGGKTVVFATDCTLTEDQLPKVPEFARDCDLLLCDGQFSDAEWAQRARFGHNTWTAVARLAAACGAKQARAIHHDITHTDDILDAAEAEVRAICPVCGIAVQGEEILL